jgi:tripartite-type tricarboxylate transporter receptor subunit TctC
MVESGLPGVQTSLWFGLYVPAGTPAAIVNTLAAASKQAMHTPAAMEALHKQGDAPLDAGPDEFARFIKSEIAGWTKVAQTAGI